MKKALFIFFLFPIALLKSQVSGDVHVTLIGAAAVQDSMDLKVNIADTTTHNVGSYTTPTQADAKANKSGFALTGLITPADSTKGFLILDSDGVKWLLRVNTEGVLSADSTGQN